MSTPPPEEISRTTRVIIHGASGRMGSRLRELALSDPTVALIGAITRGDGHRDSPLSLTPSNPQKTLENSGFSPVVIDFSSDAGVAGAVAIARRSDAALLVGTTGLTDQTIDSLRRESSERAVLVAPNTSLGVAVLAKISADAARALGQAFDVSIVEAHHNRKKDAPSGTALRFAHALRASGAALRDDQILAVRGGDVIGEHTIRFAGPGETIELTHRAVSRDLFVLGALRAAKWLRSQPAGWWTMDDALALDAS